MKRLLSLMALFLNAVVISYALNAPLALNANGASVSLAWGPSAGATGYKVFWAEASGGPYTTGSADAGNTLSSEVSGLALGQSYYFVVESYNGTLFSPGSNEVQFEATSSTSPLYLQGAISIASSGSSISQAFTSSEVATDTNVIGIEWYHSTAAPPISSVTDTNGNTYTLASVTGPTTNKTAIYYCSGVIAGADTLTVTFSGAINYASIAVAEYRSLGAFDAASSSFGASSGPATSGNLTTTQSGDVVIGFSEMNSADLNAIETGYTNRLETTDSKIILADSTAGAAGSYAFTQTLTASCSWDVVAVAFKP